MLDAYAGPGTAQSTHALDLEIWCPCCHGAALALRDRDSVCAACSTSFPIVNGVPVLINDANSVFAVSDYQQAGSYEGANYGSDSDSVRGMRRLYRRAAHALTEFGVPTSEFDAGHAIAQVARHSSQPRVLVIGSGVLRYDAPARFTYTDVAFSPGVQIISDAHDLPFADEAFDLVIAVAVLEHVVDPPRVVEEIKRVLQPNGWVYAVTPFLQPVHMGAYDFTRYTLLGHRRLFRWFKESASGMAQGPGAVAGSAVRSLLLCVSDVKVCRSLMNLAGILVSVPLKLLDHLTKHRKSALDGAGGVYFFGQKQSVPLSDRELIRRYRGGF